MIEEFFAERKIDLPARTLANDGFQHETAIAGRRVIFAGDVYNAPNAKSCTQTNVGKGINASLNARVT